MKKFYLILIFTAITLGNQVKAQWVCGQDITDTRDSRVYKTVLIGNQCWMAENLNYGTRISSTKAGYEMTDNAVVEKYCWHDTADYCDGTNGKMKKGGFYEWKEAMQYYGGQPSLPVQGVCPTGWHIPSNAEWNTLLNGLGGTNAYQQMITGGSSGFNALLTGYRCTMTGGYRTSAMMDPVEWRGYYWTSEQTDAENAPFLELAATQITAISFYKSVGLSVRCIKDATNDIQDQQMHGLNIKSIIHSYDYTLSVEFATNNQSNLSYTVVGMDGRLVLSGNYSASVGVNTIQVENLRLASGIYVFKIGDQRISSNKKFLIE